MPKRIALHDSVTVDATNLSNMARAVTFSSEHAEVDVSGFSASGANESLSGPTTQEVTVEFFGSYGVGETWATLWPIHKNREIVVFTWRPDQNTPVSATNPELKGNVQLYTFGSPSATRGDVDTFTATFRAADALGFDFVTVP